MTSSCFEHAQCCQRLKAALRSKRNFDWVSKCSQRRPFKACGERRSPQSICSNAAVQALVSPHSVLHGWKCYSAKEYECACGCSPVLMTGGRLRGLEANRDPIQASEYGAVGQVQRQHNRLQALDVLRVRQHACRRCLFKACKPTLRRNICLHPPHGMNAANCSGSHRSGNFAQLGQVSGRLRTASCEPDAAWHREVFHQQQARRTMMALYGRVLSVS